MSISKNIAFAIIVLASLCLTLHVFADTQVRIVRLSDVEGSVQMNRGNNRSYEKAFLNLPIVQGNQVRTKSDGRAQIEFEDGSSLRLAPNSHVEFAQLSLSDSGEKLSTVNLLRGTAYVSFNGSKDHQVILAFGDEQVIFSKPVHLRVELTDEFASVAVFSGDAEVRTPSELIQVAKNRTAIFDLDDNDRSKLAKNLEPAPYDAWDKQQNQYQQRYGVGSNSISSPYSYGAPDLNYYGTYFNAPGYGLVWQPYFVDASWNPFWDGAWALYPGIGYGWVSAYPWGWLPYHSGSWVFIPGRGYAWQPGPTWVAFNSQPRVLNAPASFIAPKPPSSGPNLVVINHGPVTSFAGRSTNKLIIQNNSAGVGIPRGGINNLAEVSQRVSSQGAVTQKVHVAAANTAPIGGGYYDRYQGRTAGRPLSSPTSSANRSGNTGTPHSSGAVSPPIGRYPR